VVAAASLLLGGCSAANAPSSTDTSPTVLPTVECVPKSGGGAPVRLMLQWLPQAQFAGYFVAACLGFFDEAGLDVTIIPTGGDIVPQQALFDGDADYAVAWVPKVLGTMEGTGIE